VRRADKNDNDVVSIFSVYFIVFFNANVCTHSDNLRCVIADGASSRGYARLEFEEGKLITIRV
jgi:hypothetical protein